MWGTIWEVSVTTYVSGYMTWIPYGTSRWPHTSMDIWPDKWQGFQISLSLFWIISKFFTLLRFLSLWRPFNVLGGGDRSGDRAVEEQQCVTYLPVLSSHLQYWTCMVVSYRWQNRNISFLEYYPENMYLFNKYFNVGFRWYMYYIQQLNIDHLWC